MAPQLLFATLAILAGVAASLQGAANAGLSRAVGLGAALVINTLVVLAGSLALWAATGARTSFWAPGVPWTLYLGGVCGFVIIASMAFVFPKIGAAYAVALMIGGQCAAALVADHFGVLGMPRDPVTAQRLVGVALVATGAVVMRA